MARTLLPLVATLLTLSWAILGNAGAPQRSAVEGRIVTNEVMPEIPPSIRVSLDADLHTGYVTSDGKFKIHHVPDGSYLLNVQAINYTFAMYRVDVSDSKVNAYVMSLNSEWSSTGPSISYPIELAAQEKRQFFTPREGFNLIAMFSNPMMLMMLFSVGIMFFAPKMMENMDPQALEEAKKHAPTATNPQAALPDLSQSLASMFGPKGQQASSTATASGSNVKQRRK